MAAKTFLEVFSRYNPEGKKRELIDRIVNAEFRYLKTEQGLRIEVNAYFNQHEDAEIIYEIADDCRDIYSFASMNIMPHFPEESFSIDRFSEITYEASRFGAITHGFFDNATYNDDGETIRVEIPFSARGVEFVNDSNTESILARILESRYGISRKVVIAESSESGEFMRRFEARRDDIIKAAVAEDNERIARERREAFERRQAEAVAADPYIDFESRVGISFS